VRGDRAIGLVELTHQVNARCGGDVLDRHAQLRHLLEQRSHLVGQEGGLPVEDVEHRIGRLCVHEQRDPPLRHDLEQRAEVEQVGATALAVRRGTGRVELHTADHAGFPARDQIRGIDVRCEVQRHQRAEVDLGRIRCVDDAIPIRRCIGNRRDGGHQVRHDERVAEVPSRIADDRSQHLVVTQMHVPVIGPREVNRDHVVAHPSTLASPTDPAPRRPSTRSRREEPC